MTSRDSRAEQSMVINVARPLHNHKDITEHTKVIAMYETSRTEQFLDELFLVICYDSGSGCLAWSTGGEQMPSIELQAEGNSCHSFIRAEVVRVRFICTNETII